MVNAAEIPALTVATGLVIGVPALLVAIATYWLAVRAHNETEHTERVQIDAAAYDRARELYESAIANMREQVADMRTEMTRLRVELESTRHDLRQLQSSKEAP